MEERGSFFEEKLAARMREPARAWHYLPVAAGLCFAVFGFLSAGPDRICDVTATSMRPSILAASLVVGLMALGMLLVRPRRARFAVASSLLMIAGALMAFTPYRPILVTQYLNTSVHDPRTATQLAERIVSLGEPVTDDETRLDVVLGRYFTLDEEDRVPALAFGVSFWPREDVPLEFDPHAHGAEGGVRRARAFMISRNVMWYAPGDSIPLFLICESKTQRVPLEAWVNVEGELGVGTIEGTTEPAPTMRVDKAAPGKPPKEAYLRRQY